MINKNRPQPLRPSTGRTWRIIKIICAFLILTVTVALGVHTLNMKYVAPRFEKNAKTGSPMPGGNYRYNTVTPNYDYTFALAHNLYRQEDDGLFIYFTNPKTNTVNLMCEVVDVDTGKTLYKSRVLTPGKYIDRLEPASDFSLGDEAVTVAVYVYAFQQETWYSEGTTEMYLVLQPN